MVGEAGMGQSMNDFLDQGKEFFILFSQPFEAINGFKPIRFQG